MIRARLFAIACGYEDCDDLDALRFDPAFKLACGRLSETGDDLMSQPTLSRLENAPSWRQLVRMGLSMIDLFCASFKAVPERIVLDIDDTDDTVHGGQQLALFNAHYDDYCFQPIHIFEAATAKPVLSLLAPRQAAFRERGGAYPQARHPPHPAPLAPGGNYRAWRWPLRHARGHGTPGRPRLRLYFRPIRQCPAEQDRPAVVRGRGGSPRGSRERTNCAASSRPATGPKAGHASAGSSPASRPPRRAPTYASSSPT